MTELQPPIRWGISSTGRIASKFVQGLRWLDDAAVAAVGSRSDEGAERFGHEHGIERRHGSLAALADDPDVDVVYVSSTANAHCEQTLAYLEAGKPVLCEKPFAVNQAQAQRMVDAAVGNGVFLMEAMWSRFQPGYVRLQRLLQEGVIGRPLHLEAEFAFRVPPSDRPGNRLFDNARLGGALVDLGIYPIHLAHLVFGEPQSVAAVSVLDDGVDLQTSLTLGWPGATATLFTSVDVAGRNEARIVGEDGEIRLAGPMHVTPRVEVTVEGQRRKRFGTRVTTPGLQYQATEVHRCLRENRVESDVMPHADTLAMMRTLDAARAQVGLTFPGD